MKLTFNESTMVQWFLEQLELTGYQTLHKTMSCVLIWRARLLFPFRVKIHLWWQRTESVIDGRASPHSSFASSKKKSELKARPANLCELTDWLWLLHWPPPPPANVSMCAADDASAGCSLRPDHKPAERSQQGGSSITQKGVAAIGRNSGDYPMWCHPPVQCEMASLKNSQMFWTGTGTDCASASSRRSGEKGKKKQPGAINRFATTRQKISEP